MPSFSHALIWLSTFSLSIASAQAQTAAQLEEFSNTTLGKIALAVISAVLSLLVGYILLYIKERREPAKRLSYNVEFKKGMLGIEERLARDLTVTYRGRSASNIGYVRCDLLNSGSSIIRDQRVRFQFAQSADILDSSVDPKPPKEVGLSRLSESDSGKNEIAFNIEYLERQKSINFHFVIEGDITGGVQLFGYNKEDDVQVVPGDIGIAADDRKIIEKALFIYFLTLFVPHVLFEIPVFGRISAGIFYFIAFLAVLPSLPTVARTIGALIVKLQANQRPTISFDYVHAGGHVILGAGDVSAVQKMLTPNESGMTLESLEPKMLEINQLRNDS